MHEMLKGFDNYNIVPAKITKVKHRSECLPYYDAFWSTDADAWSLAGATLPLFTAPMACVVDDKNYMEFDKNGIIPIIPRTVPYDIRVSLLSKMIWVAMGLEEFENFIKSTDHLYDETYICVDVANGHMQSVLDICKSAKEKFGEYLVLMAGNIANPLVYEEYAAVGIDYIRVMIGSGSGCATNDLTGIGANACTLLPKIRFQRHFVNANKENYKSVPKIVYDGGCESIRDIIIALALGADYVMCGKLFAHAKEAAGEIIPKLMDITSEVYRLHDNIKYLEDETRKEFVPGRIYYGMSTERAQYEMGKIKIKHSEGKEYWIPIKYTLTEWVSQFNAAISSTMSYCNTKTLQDFIGKVKVE